MSSNVMGAPIKDPKKLFISHYFYYVSCLFINIAAHELRTPIQPILGLAEIVALRLKKINN